MWEEYLIPNQEPTHIQFEIKLSNQAFALSIYVTILTEKVRC